MKKQSAIRPTNLRTEVKDSPGRGRGVFALQAIKEGEVIEVAPALYIPSSDSTFLGLTMLSCYTFGDDASDGEWLALGHASMYNHQDKPSAEWAVGKGVIVVRAVKAIEAGEEITFNYGWDDDFLAEQGIK